MGPRGVANNKATAKNGRKKNTVEARRLLGRLRLLQKRASERRRNKGEIIRYPRTVELASPRRDERNQLCFALALGLCPKFSSTMRRPVVQLEKLNSQVFAEAAKRTKDSILKMFQQRKEEMRRKRESQRFSCSQSSDNLVDLVSSDEETDDESVIIVESRPAKQISPKAQQTRKRKDQPKPNPLVVITID